MSHNIHLVEVSDKKGLKKFVTFPMDLYKGNNYFVPPIIQDEIRTLDSEKNPVFNKAKANFFLAYKDKKIVGRICAIINWTEVKEQGKKKMRFGWFDTIDDIEVTKALIEKVEEIGKENQLEYIEGPVGFSNLEKAGLLTKGFDQLATMVTWYNHPYYQTHLENLGFEKASEWVEYQFDAPTKLPEKVVKFVKIVQERYKLKVLEFKNKNEIIPWVDRMFHLLDKTYSSLSSYVPIAKEQIEYYKEKYVSFINPDFMVCITDENDELVTFVITMPSYSKALRKANGKIFPFGWYHLLKASKTNDSTAFYLIGIDPKYQGKGLTALVFTELLKTFDKYKIKTVETNPELEENKSVQLLWKDYNPVNHKRRRSYRRDIKS